MDSGQAADLSIFLLCSLLLLGYAVAYFRIRSFSVFGRRYVNLYGLNIATRKEWIVLLSQDAKEGINAVQTVRNLIIAVSILAAATATMVSMLINVMTDAQKLQQVASFAAVDPLSSQQLLTPPVKLGIAMGLLLLAIMAFAQSVRLAVHVGFTVRVVASDPAAHKTLAKQSITFMRRSSLYFAIGLRFVFATGPFLLYLLGPMSLLVSTILDIAAQVCFDIVPAGEEEAVSDEEEEAAADGQERARDTQHGQRNLQLGQPAPAQAMLPLGASSARESAVVMQGQQLAALS